MFLQFDGYSISSWIVLIHPPRRTTLWFQIAWPVLLFVVAGSLGLAAWLQAAAQRESHAVFKALARTNADFIRDAHLPESEQMMGYLGRLLNLQAFLARGQAELLPLPEGDLVHFQTELRQLQTASGVVQLGSRYEAIAAQVDEGRRLILVRHSEPALAFVGRRETAVVLGAFWLFSVALAWAITRGVVRPLRLLAERLPSIEHDAEAALPGAERSDEIGQVARAYLAARSQLAEERARREKAERQALLGRMATGLAHEIHNPLAAIRLHAELLQSATPDELEPTLRESVPVLLDETVRIEGLVNQWMFLARPEPPRVSLVRLADVVSTVIRSQQAVAAHAGIRLAVDVSPEFETDADARRLGQAVSNVVINAIQAMRRTGSLSITAAAVDGSVCLIFRDTGPGFSSEALARYRELFFSQREGGMGIGLSVSAEILEAHGGKLDVTNAPGGGAIVTFSLPAAHPAKLQASPTL